MKLSTARYVVWSSLAAVVLFGLIALMTESPVFYVLMVLAVVAEMVVFFGFIKCPHCGHRLDRVGMNPNTEFCPFCGKSLKDRDEE